MTQDKVSLKASDFVHLHNHTHFSVLDGLTKIGPMVEQVKNFGMTAIALTDHGTMSGVIDFYKQAKNNELKPIIGMETYIASRKYTDKEAAKDKLNYHLTLLAMNDKGYKNLMRLSTIANLEGFYYRPRIDFDLLTKYNEGIIVLSGCIGGEVGDNLRNGQYDKARDIAKKYQQLFSDRYFIEIQDHGHKDHPGFWIEQERVNQQLLKLAEELNIEAVLTCDSHYLKSSEKEAHEVLLCVQTGSYLNDTDRMSLKDFDLHLTNPTEIIARWGKDHPELILNSRSIADRCQVNIELGKILIPKFPVPEGKTEASYLHELVFNGLAKKYLSDNDGKLSATSIKKQLPAKILNRTQFELKVIQDMGFQGYFLIIHDFVSWGKQQGIVFGPGRGSAAGSIVSYALDITTIDPLKYDLLFERFLNPERISMPDVDIDIMDTRRDEVIKYCTEKYGVNRVANIVTFGTMAARNAVRDVARTLEIPYAEADRLAKMIPPPVQGRHIPLKVSLVEDKDLKNEYETNPSSKRIFDLAIILEGTIRSHGVHAAGVVISPSDIVDYTPLEMAQKGVVATQYSMQPIEELGLLKMDFLGLSNLTIIKNALRIIKKVYGQAIDISTIPLDDDKTFKLLQRGETTGVFQLESAGMKRYLKALKPTQFDDIIAMVALYRPGPMQFIDDFISRKHGEKAISYLHPSMENVLKTTYGVLVYQEQVMQISKEICGFSGGEADTLRKAIGKKNIDMMRKMKQRMIEGAKETSNIDKSIMETFWKQLEDFAAYCFNKSHAACYGLIAYQTAYLKAHYPAALMASIMTANYNDIDRLAIAISECNRLSIPVLLPDVNQSFGEFAVILDNETKKPLIRFGLNAIKNVGSNTVEEIIKAREDKPFNTIEDFLIRVNYQAINRKSLESLIKSGALDSFYDRGFLLDSLDDIIAFSAKVQKQITAGQMNLFNNEANDEADSNAHYSLNLPTNIQPVVTNAMLAWERELLGIYLSHNPLDVYQHILEEQVVAINLITKEMDGMSTTIGGIISGIKEVTTKNNQKMAFVQLADQTANIELILFPSIYQQTIGNWNQDKVMLVRGKISAKDQTGLSNDEIKFIVNDAREITEEQAKSYVPTNKKIKPPKPRVSNVIAKNVDTITETKLEPKMYLRLESISDELILKQIKQTIDNYRGNSEIIMVVGQDANKQIIRLPSGVNINNDLKNIFEDILGQENVVIK